MYKGCALDADADVNSPGTPETDVYARVYPPVLKPARLHIPPRMDVQKSRRPCIKEAAYQPGIRPWMPPIRARIRQFCTDAHRLLRRRLKLIFNKMFKRGCSRWKAVENPQGRTGRDAPKFCPCIPTAPHCHQAKPLRSRIFPSSRLRTPEIQHPQSTNCPGVAPAAGRPVGSEKAVWHAPAEGLCDRPPG